MKFSKGRNIASVERSNPQKMILFEIKLISSLPTLDTRFELKPEGKVDGRKTMKLMQ